jgi:hypothetical protein
VLTTLHSFDGTDGSAPREMQDFAQFGNVRPGFSQLSSENRALHFSRWIVSA